MLVAFERLGLDEVRCLTIADNTAVVSFHDRCGYPIRREVERDGVRFVEHVTDAANLEQLRSHLTPGAQRVAERLARPARGT
jgi:hypothetical protein